MGCLARAGPRDRRSMAPVYGATEPRSGLGHAVTIGWQASPGWPLRGRG